MKHIACGIVVFCLLGIPGSILTVSAGPCFTLPDDPSLDVIEMITQINETMMYSYLTSLVAFGPRYTGSDNCTQAGQYLYDTFRTLRYSVEFHTWSEHKFTCRNVVATLEGSDSGSNATYILSAHYDTVLGSPGANDDGSGVAALLAIAHVLQQYSFKHTIQFIAFSGEEVGTYGSYAYARDAYRRSDNIVAVLNLDMIGYANTTEGGKILRFFYPERSKWIADSAHQIGEVYEPWLNISVGSFPNYIGADHQAFIDYGYDGVWIAHADGYPWGHSPQDTVDRINFTYFTKATRLALVILTEFARTPLELQVVLTYPFEGYLHIANRPILPLNLGRAWHIGLRGATVVLGKTTAEAEVHTNQSIQYVIFCVDGNFQFGWSSSPPYQCEIRGIHYPFFGKHTLKVYAYTTSGCVATDEMNIYIFTLGSRFNRRS